MRLAKISCIGAIALMAFYPFSTKGHSSTVSTKRNLQSSPIPTSTWTTFSSGPFPYITIRFRVTSPGGAPLSDPNLIYGNVAILFTRTQGATPITPACSGQLNQNGLGSCLWYADSGFGQYFAIAGFGGVDDANGQPLYAPSNTEGGPIKIVISGIGSVCCADHQ